MGKILLVRSFHNTIRMISEYFSIAIIVDYIGSHMPKIVLRTTTISIFLLDHNIMNMELQLFNTNKYIYIYNFKHIYRNTQHN